MSTYQYYEFRAVDRPLNEKQLERVGKLSSRAEITPTSFINVYNYGEFRGNPDDLVNRYFDAFVYVANWGTRTLKLRLPRGVVDREQAHQYCGEESLNVRETKGHLILDFTTQDEHESGWEEGAGWMDRLLPLRAELMAGDLRGLYLAWLSEIQFLDDEESEDLDELTEPPLPPGLQDLTPAQTALVDFLRINTDLVAAAGEGDSGSAPGLPTKTELAAWIKTIGAAEKDEILLRLVGDEAPHLRWELMRRYYETVSLPELKKTDRTLRTLFELRLAAEQRRKKQESRKREAAKRQREKKAAAEREKRIDALVGGEEKAGNNIDELIDAKRANEYDQALALLRDLHGLAQREGRVTEVERKIQNLREKHSTKVALMRRFANEGWN